MGGVPTCLGQQIGHAEQTLSPMVIRRQCFRAPAADQRPRTVGQLVAAQIDRPLNGAWPSTIAVSDNPNVRGIRTGFPDNGAVR